MKKIFFFLLIIGCITLIVAANFHPFFHGTFLQALNDRGMIDIMWMARLQILPFMIYFFIFAGFTKNNNTVLLYFTSSVILTIGFTAVLGTPGNRTNEVPFFGMLWFNLFLAIFVPIISEIIQDRKRAPRNFNH